MGYRLKINGQDIEFPSKADAEAFLLKQVLAPVGEGGRKPNGDARPVKPSNARMVADFLKAIRDGGVRGVDTIRIMKAVGIDSPVAFGNRGKNIHKLLGRLGFTEHDVVYTNHRNDKGDREWKAGPKIAEAIEAVNKQLGGA
jgi:hypothetical protein